MNKLEGLREIHRLGLAHPKWEFIKEVSEIQYLGEDDEYAGWTIRTCLDNENGENEFNLPHYNWLSKNSISNAINKIQAKIKKPITFVVYPSWKFIKAANIMFLKDKIIIEVVQGEIQKLLYGGNPDLLLIYSRLRYPKIISIQGLENLLSSSELQSLLSIEEKIVGQRVIQWSHTTKDKYFFHDLREII